MDSVTSPRGVTGDVALCELRPMALDDIDAVMGVVDAAEAAQAEAGQVPVAHPTE